MKKVLKIVWKFCSRICSYRKGAAIEALYLFDFS